MRSFNSRFIPWSISPLLAFSLNIIIVIKSIIDWPFIILPVTNPAVAKKIISGGYHLNWANWLSFYSPGIAVLIIWRITPMKRTSLSQLYPKNYKQTSHYLVPWIKFRYSRAFHCLLFRRIENKQANIWWFVINLSFQNGQQFGSKFGLWNSESECTWFRVSKDPWWHCWKYMGK